MRHDVVGDQPHVPIHKSASDTPTTATASHTAHCKRYNVLNGATRSFLAALCDARHLVHSRGQRPFSVAIEQQKTQQSRRARHATSRWVSACWRGRYAVGGQRAVASRFPNALSVWAASFVGMSLATCEDEYGGNTSRTSRSADPLPRDAAGAGPVQHGSARPHSRHRTRPAASPSCKSCCLAVRLARRSAVLLEAG